MTRKRIPSLDGLRAISIIIVVWGHTNTSSRVLGLYSFFGVQIFFVISGYLITTLLLGEHDRTGTIDLRAFYVRRVLRIFPAAYAYILVIALFFRPPLEYLAYAFTYTSCYAGPHGPWMLGHLWSLSVEEQFYLLWPFALLLAFSSRKQVLWGVMLSVPVIRYVCIRVGWLDIHRYFPTVADSLAAGCLLAVYFPALSRRCQWMTRPWVAAALAIAALIAARFQWSSRTIVLFFSGVVPLFIALIMFVAIERQDWFLNNFAMREIGTLSYSIYLWQEMFLGGNLGGFDLLIRLCCVASFAYGSYYFVERPALRLQAAKPIANLETLLTPLP